MEIWDYVKTRKWFGELELDEAELDQLRTSGAQSVRMSLEAIIVQFSVRRKKSGERFENGKLDLPRNQQSPICTSPPPKDTLRGSSLRRWQREKIKRKRLDRRIPKVDVRVGERKKSAGGFALPSTQQRGP